MKQLKHVIFGAGNLGKDLLLEINARHLGAPVLLSKSKGHNCADIEVVRTLLIDHAPDVVWYCIGGGSVAEANNTPREAAYFNLHLPLALCSMLPTETKLVVFSTDYVADETRPSQPAFLTQNPRSHYAQLKMIMEQELRRMNRPNTLVVRVGSLYGLHKPEKTFPGKLIANAEKMNGQPFKLPSNIVVPTPTRWLAGMLATNFSSLFSEHELRLEHCAPTGGVTTSDWGKFIMEGKEGVTFVKGNDYLDNERPYFSGLGCSFAPVPHWHELWKTYFKREWFFKFN